MPIENQKLNQETDESSQIKLFLDKYSPTLITIMGAATFLGGVIWLTARYLRESKKRDVETDSALAQIEDEAVSSTDETTVFLETGSYLSRVGGDELIDATEKLCQNTDDPELNQALSLVHDFTINSQNEFSSRR